MKKSLALLAIIAFPALSQPVNIDTGNTGTGKTVHQTSPTLTGTPLAPTAALGTNTTQLATTAFVLANGGTPTWSSMTGQAIVTSYPALAADTLPSATIIHGQDAWSQATTAPKQTGANLVLAGGIGQRLITFVTPNSTGGKIVTFTANGTATNLTEGTNFACNTLTTSQCATNLAAAIVANGTLTALMTPTANVSAGVVHLDPKAGLYSLVVTDDAGAAITETEGANGSVVATQLLAGGATPTSAPAASVGFFPLLWSASDVSGIGIRNQGGSGYNYLGAVYRNLYAFVEGNPAMSWRGQYSSVGIPAAYIFGWSSTTDPNNMPLDTALSRSAAGVVAVGNGTAGDTSGTLKAAVLHLVTLSAPTCDATHRGQFNYTAGGSGVADVMQVCAKGTADTYAWYPIATIP